jgi:hypothetical protein
MRINLPLAFSQRQVCFGRVRLLAERTTRATGALILREPAKKPGA